MPLPSFHGYKIMNIIILDEIEWEYIQEAVVEQSITTLNESQWEGDRADKPVNPS